MSSDILAAINVFQDDKHILPAEMTKKKTNICEYWDAKTDFNLKEDHELF